MIVSEPQANRRDFLAGRALRDEVIAVGQAAGDAILGGTESARVVPTSGPTVRLTTRAMATDFAVILNETLPDDPRQPLRWASEALDLVQVLEDQLSVYRPHTELSQLNRAAAAGQVSVEARLFALLCRARKLCLETDGCFDPTAGPLIALWRQCRQEARLPTTDEIAARRSIVGMQHVTLNANDPGAELSGFVPSGSGGDRRPLPDGRGSTALSLDECFVAFDRAGVELNLGSIGKGYAVDRAGELLLEHGLTEWLIQGGHSSVLARGGHNGLAGWPIGLRNPLLPQRTLGTILLRDQALATSGTAVQHFRFEGQRYGHIIDPRSGWPAEVLLSVTALAPTAAEADALSTAIFVGGVEIAERYCSNHPSVSAVLIPPPASGQRLRPICIALPDGVLFWDDELAPTN